MISQRLLPLGLLLLFGLCTTLSSRAQSIDPVLYESVEFRSIGPFRGGRSAAVTGVADDPMLYYFGSAGGGVWKTDDGGATWDNISDGYFGGSIGAIAVAPSDPSVIYVGGGEKTVRGNVSHGEGMYRSEDGGATWKKIGLEDSRHITRIRVHPDDPDTLYVSALGHLYGPNQERGVYRSRDGGQSWQRVLFVSDMAGAVDLIMDPRNARVLYATTWRVLRTPYSLESGGEGSGIYKTIDGGETWTELSHNPGMPKGTLGICGVAVSPLDSKRVWAIVEAAEGGVFRSDDSGATWRRVNTDRNLRQRAWYYSRIYAGPDSIDDVYVLNVGFWRSKDGGENFDSIRTPHSDHHDLWIDPAQSSRMIIGDDGGAQVTYNGGRTWSEPDTQPTAQFYRVTTDNHFPYRIYGAQQDNSTVRILSRSDSGSIGERDWESTAGGESGHIAPDPTNPEIVYGGSYGGYLTRYNHATGKVRNIHVWPDNPMGHGAGDNKYRFQWNFPIFFSPHDPKTLYTAANVLFKTNDEGQSWTRISPDLTRNDASKLGPSGGPITKDNTSVEYYATIFSALESPHEPGVLWVGSDDGLVQLSQDAGETWTNVTPPDLPEWTQINSMEAHPTEKGGLYLAGTRYKLDDFQPYLYKTLDYGKTWTKITRGIADKHFTRVIRADRERPGLLFAGAESGLYLSWNDGADWVRFQQNLPLVPITDLAIKDNDLIVATQGRSFWVLDDLTFLHQLKPGLEKSAWHVWRPRPLHRLSGRGGFRSRTTGSNPYAGAEIRFWLRDLPEKETLRLQVVDPQGEPVQVYSTQPKDGEERLVVKAGVNRFRWDLRYPDAETFPGLVLWAGGTNGPRAVPGDLFVQVHPRRPDHGNQFGIAAGSPRRSDARRSERAVSVLNRSS